MRWVRVIIGLVYQCVVKPILFLFDAEKVHTNVVRLGSSIGKFGLVRCAFRYDNPILEQTIDGAHFKNPIGLAAGFDYDGYLAHSMGNVGFGFSTIGTVTALPYEGNVKPRLARLPRSQSLLVNKGFKSQGTKAIAQRLDQTRFGSALVGISVGSSNVPQIDTVQKAIDDYAATFVVFSTKPYVSYFELNISCPNVAIGESFLNLAHFEALLMRIQLLGIAQPIYVKMPNEIEFNNAQALMARGLKYGMKGFIFSNLVKDRTNPAFDQKEIKAFAKYKGNFSGRPVKNNANTLIRFARAFVGDRATIIGCGGVFSATDAYEKITCGADLVQLITGMIYQGPQLIGQINEGMVKLLCRDGYASLQDARAAAFERME